VPDQAKILIVAHDWNLVGEVIWPKLSKPGGLKLPKTGPKTPPILPERWIADIAWMDKKQGIPRKVFIKHTGATITFKSAEAGEKKFTGSEFDLIWNDEEIANEQIFQEEIRAVTDSMGNMIWTATPQVRSTALLMLHEKAEAGDKEFPVAEFVLDTLTNQYIPKASREAFASMIPEDYKESRLHGEFQFFEGLVYQDWIPRVHEVPMPPPEAWNGYPRVLIIDPGYANPCAVLWVVALPTKPVSFIGYREYYRKRQTVRAVAEHIRVVSGNEPIVRAIIDKESLKKNMGYKTSIFKQFNQEFRNVGLRNALSGKPLQCRLSRGGLEDTIFITKQWLIGDEVEVPRWRITGNLHKFKFEIRRYIRKADKRNTAVSEKPIDRDNHLISCWRYLAADPIPFVLMGEAARAAESPSYRAYKELKKKKGKKVGRRAPW
jgi:phage terminase large subunit-like protein